MSAVWDGHIAAPFEMRGRQRTIAFRAWRVAVGGTYPLDIGQPDTLADALAEAQLGNCIHHRETVLVHEHDAGRNAGVLRAYAVKQKSQPDWVKCPETGITKAVRRLYLDQLFTLSIINFDPVRPFDALRDDATGVDRTLVSVREA